MRENTSKERFMMLLGAGFVMAFFFYGSLLKDTDLCYKVPVCPQIRTVLVH
jgi:hypothetical protein